MGLDSRKIYSLSGVTKHLAPAVPHWHRVSGIIQKVARRKLLTEYGIIEVVREADQRIGNMVDLLNVKCPKGGGMLGTLIREDVITYLIMLSGTGKSFGGQFALSALQALAKLKDTMKIIRNRMKLNGFVSRVMLKRGS